MHMAIFHSHRLLLQLLRESLHGLSALLLMGVALQATLLSAQTTVTKPTYSELLAASKMYIDMAKRGGKNSEMYLSRSSQYTLTAIEEIRKLAKGLTTDTIKSLGLCEAIDNLTRDTMEANPVKISYRLENFTENCVNDKFKLNVFRIVQEQLNNILKHAKATVVTINLSQNKQSIMLAISDNGVGFDTNQKRDGIGITNIKSRAVSYNGKADFVSEPGKGCALTVTFPVTDALLNKN